MVRHTVNILVRIARAALHGGGGWIPLGVQAVAPSLNTAYSPVPALAGYIHGV